MPCPAGVDNSDGGCGNTEMEVGQDDGCTLKAGGCWLHLSHVGLGEAGFSRSAHPPDHVSRLETLLLGANLF